MNTTTTTAPQKSNIRKLAEIIYATGRSKEIMAALEIVLSFGAGALAPTSAPSAPSAEKGGEKA